ncbi:hypothetical protein S141_16 [Shewanella sp. phage 1/41]|uniref:hypothetical protein n=1 Tax=Shewanella sp. phage 1/41 TaxID=1458861 RepID=UPI0004F74264|nr:hypothetical protein S141_16 [Shewanella sp. phage 1/41]AHK11662.1 hypothetical protein S141_16 [Shewanella sp. phage 1/41]
MPSTRIAIPQGVWAPIVTVGADGWVNQTQGDTQVVYVIAESAPSPFDTETPTRYETERRQGFEFDGLAASESIWAYAVNGDAEVSVSVEQGASLNLDADYFNGLAGFIVQSYTEANSKLGVQHEGSAIFEAIPALGVNSTIFLTGALPVALKGRIINFSGVGVKGEIFTGATYTGGTEVEYQNASDINPVTGLAKIIVGATITSVGTTAFAPTYSFGNESNQGKGGVQSTLGGEKLLKPNTAYLLRLVSLDTQPQDISSFLSWYEGELDMPRL